MADRNARVWNGSEWESISSSVFFPNAVVVFQASSPSSPVTGQIWIDSDDNVTYIWSGSSWVAVSVTSEILNDTIENEQLLYIVGAI